MSNEQPVDNWLAEALKNAKESTLPYLVETWVTSVDTELDVESVIDAIEAALLTVVGEITEAKIRTALQPLAEMYAEALDIGWEHVADAIIGTLESPRPNRANDIINW